MRAEDEALRRLLGEDRLRLLAGIAAEMGITAWLVGGGLRDVLLGRPSKDLDFALTGEAETLPRRFAEKIGGSFFWLDRERRQSRVVKREGEELDTFDFAPLRGADIGEDLAARDFTINSLAVTLHGGNAIIDPSGGMDDLRGRVIRVSSTSAFDADPLRMLRAFRQAAALGFSIHDATLALIREKAHLLGGVAAERIRSEFCLILAASGATRFLRGLAECSLLNSVLPFDLSGMETRLGRVSSLEDVAHRLALVPAGGEKLGEALGREVECGVTVLALAKLALLVPDSAAAADTARRLRLGTVAGRVLGRLVVWEVRRYPMAAKRLTPRACFRFFRDSEPAGPAMLAMAADGGLPAAACRAFVDHYVRAYDPAAQDLLLTGEEIMEVLGIGPGKALGEIVLKLRRAEASGEVADSGEARLFIKNQLTKPAEIG
ncbi:MAG: CCA tRNA nucleotidyltransferase [Geobacter sp.]|nr:CCA tRNA nucleotidyltransferase [Geobacter sp.]